MTFDGVRRLSSMAASHEAASPPKVLDGPNCKVYRNPTKDMFKLLTADALKTGGPIYGTVRGLLNEDGDYYFWNGDLNVHARVIPAMGLGKSLVVEIDAIAIESRGFDWRKIFQEFNRGLVYNEGGTYAPNMNWKSGRPVHGSVTPRVIPVAEAKVYVNPTRYMLANLQREITRDHFFYARALRIGEDCYFWVSDLVTHSEVVKDLGLAGKVTGIVEFPAVYLTKWGDPNAIIEKAKHWTFGPGDPGWTAAKHDAASQMPKRLNGYAYVNPTKAMLKKLVDESAEWSVKHGYPATDASVRFLKSEDGDIYAWDAGLYGHWHVVLDLHLIGESLGRQMDGPEISEWKYDVRKCFDQSFPGKYTQYKWKYDGIHNSSKHEADFQEDEHPRGEGGIFIPAKPGTTPIPEGHVRLYHQTKEENLEPIRNEGLNLQHSRTDKYSDPVGIWADEKGWHGDPSKYPTVEFSVPKERWRAPFVTGGDVRPEDIVAIHYPWHGRARYIEENPKVLKDTLDGKHDDLLNGHDGDPEYAEYANAIRYIKNKYGRTAHIAASTPYLVPAVVSKGKVYRAEPGQTHLEAYHKIPGYSAFEPRDPSVKQVFVTQNGKVLDRDRAFDFARDNDLLADWVKGSHSSGPLIAEYLRGCFRCASEHIAGKVLNTYKCKVFINPNKDQMRTLYNSTVKMLTDHGYDKTSEEYYLRMLLIDGHLFVWEGWFEIHKDMVNILKSQGFMIPEWEQCYVTVSDMESIGLDARKLWSSLHPRSIIRTSSIKQTAHGKVVINPPKQQWANVAMGFMQGESRILEKDGVFYIWDAGADGAIHYQIALDLGLEAPYKFTMIRKWEGEQIGWDYKRLNELGPHLWHKGRDNPLKRGHIARVEDVSGAKVFVNPSRVQVKALSDHVLEISAIMGRPNKEMMRLMRNGGHIYIWDGMSSLVHMMAVREMALPGLTETRIAFPIDLEGVGYDLRRIFDRKAPTDYDIELGEDGRARIIGGMNVKGADLRSDIIARGAPAVRYRGRVYPGRRGEYHALICEQNGLPGKSEVERGYVIGGKFIPDDSLPQGIDSSELMTPMQKMRVDQDLVRDWRSR